MVSGYVCGRRASRPLIGVAAALVPLVVSRRFSWILNLSMSVWEMSTDNIYAFVVSLSPSFGPYVIFAEQYSEMYIGAIQVGTGVRTWMSTSSPWRSPISVAPWLSRPGGDGLHVR
ncbi:MAG: hypothetical protein MZV70_01415 [Desulfobacterales bacterium]|nr:hypothetical protein [Desulfobacterales bacterium]